MLVRTPSPHSDESLFGYLLRVSETNGYETPSTLLRLAGGEGHRVSLNSIPLEGLSKLLNQEKVALEIISYRTELKTSAPLKVLNHIIGKHAKSSPLRIKKSAFCSFCVQEEGYVKAFWDMSVSLACPIHHCAVMSHCPQCKVELTWFRPGLLTCVCGADITQQEHQRVKEPLLSLMQVIQNKLHGTSYDALRSDNGLPIEFIDGVSLSSLLHMINRLGVFNLDSKGESRSTDTEIICNAAIEVLSEWPSGYHNFLQRLGNRYISERPHAIGVRKQFEPFYTSLFNAPFSPDLTFLREEFVNFGLNIWGKGVVDRKLLRSPDLLIEQRFVSKAAFARRFRIWKPVMKRLIEEGYLVTESIQVGSIDRMVVDLHRSRIPEMSHGTVSDREVGLFLGLPVSVISHLRKAGLYRTKLRTGFTQSWHQEDAEEFLRRALRLGKKINVVLMGAIPLGETMRLTLRDASAKADIVAAAFDGRLTVLGRVGDKISDLLLNKEEVDQFVLIKRVAVEENSYSFPEAAKQTGIDAMAINCAINLGLLRTIDRGERTRITAESISEFNDNYIMLSQLAVTLETSAKRLANLCQEYDISITLLTRSNSKAKHFALAKRHEPELHIVHSEKKRPQDKSFDYNSKKEETRKGYESSMKSYLDALRERGGRLPRRVGKPMKTAIARACGFKRDILYDYPTVIQILDKYDSEEQKSPDTDTRGLLSRLEDYLEDLKENNQPLPRSRNQRPNKSEIAKACRFDRSTLYNCKKAVSLLEKYSQA